MPNRYFVHRVLKLSVFSSLMLAMSGCNVIVNVPDYLKIMTTHAKSTSPPKPPPEFDPKAIKAVTPKDEAKSKYGNARSYVVFGQRYYVLDSAQGFQQTGIASWYGKKFHGRRTSSGEVYDMYAMTAAHKNLPLPTYVRVRNLQNNRSVIVRVNDRGPFHEGRIIDLSYSAAYQLDMLQQGTARVHVEAVFAANEKPQIAQFPQQLATEVQGESFHIQKKNEPIISSIQPAISQKLNINPLQKTFYIQVGAFANIANAQSLQFKLAKEHQYPVKLKDITVKDKVFKRVIIGPISEQGSASILFEQLSSQYGASIRYIDD